MYHFPPTAWEVNGLSLGPLTPIYLVIVTVLIGLCCVQFSTGKVCAAWTFGGTISFFYAWASIGTLSRTWNPPYPLDIGLCVAMPILCAVGALRTAYVTVKQREDTGRWMMAGTGLGFIALLLVLFATPMGHPREAYSRTQCRNNLKQIGLAMHLYHDVMNMFPPAWQSKGTLPSWRVALLPYLEQSDLYDSYDFGKAWDAPENVTLSEQLVAVFDCPQRPKRRQRNAANQFRTAYVVPFGPESVFDGRGVRIRDITDGTTHSIMAVEACGTDIVWTEPRDNSAESRPLSVNRPASKVDRSDSLLSSYHMGGAQMLFADGSVRFVSEQIDPAVLKALSTKNAGEYPGDNW